MFDLFLKYAGNLTKRFNDGGGQPPEGPQTEPGGGPAEPQGTTPPEPLLAGKFKSPQDMERSYLELERKMSEQGQELGTLRQQAQQLPQQLPQLIEQNIQKAMEAQAAKQQQPLSAEQKREINERLLEQFNEDPTGVMQKMREEIFTEVQGTIKKQYEPLEQQVQHFDRMTKWNQQVQQVASKYPDYAEVAPLMQEVIGKHGNTLVNDPNGVEIAYFMAKGMKPAAPPSQDLLADDSFRQQVVQNQEVRNAVIADYLNQVRQGGTPPVVIGGQPAGASPSGAPMEIKTAKDATKAATGLFNKILGGGNQ